MLSDGSVSRQLVKLKLGDHAAVRSLFQGYFQRLVDLARQKLTGNARRAADEEDVALAAFARVCRRAEQGRLPDVHDRDDLWRLLVLLTVRMAIDQVRHESRQKRGGSARNGHRTAATVVSDWDTCLDQIPSRQPPPDFVAQVAEECEHRLAALDDAELRSIATWKTEGFTNREIASELGCVLRTVERKLQAIRRCWSDDDPAAMRDATPE
jgi:DNA-directed RNA polymerase specialized sigma24 family protein